MTFDSDLDGPPEPGETGPAWGETTRAQRIDLVENGAIVLESEGFRIIEPGGRKRSPLIPYESMTHVHVGERVFLIGTRSGLRTIRISDFRDPMDGPVEARRALLEALAARPDGAHWLAAMEGLDRLAERSRPPFAIWTIVAVCILMAWFQYRDPFLEQVGAFIPELFVRGEYWRAVTGQFLHGFTTPPQVLTALFGNLPAMPIHLAINVGGLLVLGHLVERPLGSWRTAMILVASGIGTVVGIVMAGHFEVIGASGLVSGLAGAILALELHHPESIPSYWRLPRRLFLMAIFAQFLVIDPLLSNYIAGGAHLGGFVGGFVAAWMMDPPRPESPEPSLRLRRMVQMAIALVLLMGFGILPLARHDMGALERHALRLLNTPPDLRLYPHENAAAWFIATGEDPSPVGLDLAVALADRAVASTGRMNPGILDTLAEAFFQHGDRLSALLTIDEAIRLVPSEAYFHEQRRRFTGERPADDRPPPPGSPRDEGFPGDDGFEGLPIDPDAPRMTI
ncbi:MAG TPA: rhomboid family intramembrane serine protease [Deltaproteobacteria bacterium]|nr:rhomboid family intramembrane serine protease [Deltaproteobacteria bacterium]